jgi:hypothetical protein
MTMSMMGAPSLKYLKAMRFQGFGEKRELVSLAQMYKPLNAPFGAFAMATLTSSSKELASKDTNDGTYNS